MPRNFTQLYLHSVWATWDRLPLVTTDIQDIIYAAIAKQCRDLGCSVIAIGGIANHMHLFTSFPPNLTISELIGKVKGSSSHLINHQVKPDSFFKWQGGYGAFSVSRNGIEAVTKYIENQAIHHRQETLVSEWEM